MHMKRSIALAALVLATGRVGAAGAPSGREGAIRDVWDGTPVTKVAGGMKFVEGPVWVGSGGYLLFTDIPANTIYKWSDADGLTPWRTPSWGANGLTLDLRGKLLACEHGSRTLTWSVIGGRRITLASRFEGARLNSPNDVVVRSDDTIYFTDPPYGLRGGKGRELEHDGVYRFDPASWRLTLLTSGHRFPNGLAFSPNERTLYVAYSNRREPRVRAFDVSTSGRLSNERVFVDLTNEKGRVPDGIKVDAAGRLYVTCDGVMVFAPDGSHLGSIPVPEVPANIAWGDNDWRTLFITARTSLYRVRLRTPGGTVGIRWRDHW
jgi:gluconolactonase